MKRLVIGLGLALAPIIGWIAGGDEYIELRHDRSQIALMYYLIAFVFTALVAERLDERRASTSNARSPTTGRTLRAAVVAGDRRRPTRRRLPGPHSLVGSGSRGDDGVELGRGTRRAYAVKDVRRATERFLRLRCAARGGRMRRESRAVHRYSRWLLRHPT
jgi:hypothetical protein